MKFYRVVILAVAFTTGALQCKAQDLLFSQYFNSPLTVNPAMTGYMRPEIRAGYIQRNQWQQIGNPFISSAVFADYSMKLGVNKGVTNDGTRTLNFGFLFLNDQLGNNAFKTQQFLLSGSFIMPFGTYYRHRIGIGVQGGYYTKAFNTKDMYFSNQINKVYEGDPNTLPSFESLENLRVSSFNFNAGAHYSFQFNKRNSLTMSYSLSNISQPKDHFVTLGNAKTDYNNPMRHFGMLSTYFQLSNRVVFNPAVIYQFQNAAREFNYGGTFAVQLNSTSQKSGLDNPFRVVLYLGTYYRFQDAIIPYVGFRYGTVTGGISYDVNINSLSDKKFAGVGRQSAKSLEFSLIYSGFFDSKTAYRYSLPWKDYFQ